MGAESLNRLAPDTEVFEVVLVELRVPMGQHQLVNAVLHLQLVRQAIFWRRLVAGRRLRCLGLEFRVKLGSELGPLVLRESVVIKAQISEPFFKSGHGSFLISVFIGRAKG